MENWDYPGMEYNLHNGQHRHRHRHRHHHHSRDQSFSSALLDAIFKSTKDEGGIMADKKSRSRVEIRNVEAKNNTNSRIERQWSDDPWMNNEKSMRGRSAKLGVFSAEKFEAEAAYSKHGESHLSFQSNVSSATSCSSDYNTSDTSSISWPYLSSDAESLYKHTSIPTAHKTQRNSHHVAARGDKACKWAVSGECCRDLHRKLSVKDGGFRSREKSFIPEDHHAEIRSMSKTRKESKKPKQPTSPGRKLVSLLNSLFMAGSIKKGKLSASSSVSEFNSYDSSERKPSSVYSSSSVQSKPGLSKTSRESSNCNGMSQKSVTFYPTGVTMDEDSRPCREKYLHRMGNLPPNPNAHNYQGTHLSTDAYNLPPLIKELELRVLEEDSHAAAIAAKEIIGKYPKDHSIMEAVVRVLEKQDEEEDEENDDASCSSSELFELENLAGIEMNNLYQKELPVYGTTHLEINKAIAKGLIV